MTIGELIISEIVKQGMVQITHPDPKEPHVLVWRENAADQLCALIQQHIQHAWMRKDWPGDIAVLKASRAAAVEQEQRTRVECNRLRTELNRFRAALVKIQDLGQDTCKTHEDQCICAYAIARVALCGLNIKLSGGEKGTR